MVGFSYVVQASQINPVVEITKEVWIKVSHTSKHYMNTETITPGLGEQQL